MSEAGDRSWRPREGRSLSCTSLKKVFLSGHRIPTVGMVSGGKPPVPYPDNKSEGLVERTFCRESSPEIKNVDLPRKVVYRKRRMKVDIGYKQDRGYREGRKKEDFDSYMKGNPAVRVVEMDTVEGPRAERRCLLTILFLNCTLQLALLRESNGSETTTLVWNRLRSKLAADEMKTLFPVVLTDNGPEFSKPELIEEDEHGEVLTRVFYCHPLASWEKGDCENNHALIRRILPKGSSFSHLTQEKVDLMMDHINSYPRPQYNGKTPYEMFVFLYGRHLAEKLGLKGIDRNDVALKPYLLK